MKVGKCQQLARKNHCSQAGRQNLSTAPGIKKPSAGCWSLFLEKQFCKLCLGSDFEFFAVLMIWPEFLWKWKLKAPSNTLQECYGLSRREMNSALTDFQSNFLMIKLLGD